MRIKLYIIELIAIFYCLPTMAMPIDGTFTATKTCDLYQSKNKKTNPQNIQTQIGQSYGVKEYLGQRDNPQWLRVITNAQQSSLRWVDSQCGLVSKQNISQTNIGTKANTETNNIAANKNESRNSGNRDKCNTANEFDSFVLALSWQNAFCELNDARRECQGLKDNPNMLANKQFSLHGLWPNKSHCGRGYGFCGAIKQKPRQFCDYPELTLSTKVRQQLNPIMPSAQYGTCLQRHEYWKHGTCMTHSADDYFVRAIGLVNQINQSNFVMDYIQQHIGYKVSRHSFQRAFEKSFGVNSHNKLTLRCNSGMLTEIQISLPQNIKETPRLAALINNAPKAARGNCPTYFFIDSNND